MQVLSATKNITKEQHICHMDTSSTSARVSRLSIKSQPPPARLDTYRKSRLTLKIL